MNSEWDGLEITVGGSFNELAQILTTQSEQLGGKIKCDPTLHGETPNILVWRCQVKLRVSPAAAYNFPGITGAVGLMNNDASHRPHLCRLLELIGPPSIIGHGRAAECLGVKLG